MAKVKEYIETTQDLLIKYHECYIAAEYPTDSISPGIPLLSISEHTKAGIFRVLTFKETGGRLVVKLRNFANKEYYLPWDSLKKNLLLDYPELGAINTHNSVAYLKRKLKVKSPTKYKKGLRIETVSYFNPNKIEQQILKLKPLTLDSHVDFSALSKYIYFKDRYTSQEALQSILTNKRLGTAFSKEYYYTLNACNNSISLWRGCNIIGAFNKHTCLFELSTSLFNDDLAQLEVPFETTKGGKHVQVI